MTVPTSNVQKQMWLINQMFPDNSAYNIPSLFKIKGDFNWARLEKSIQNVVAQHEVLRTTFHELNGELVQVVNEDLPLESNYEILNIPSKDQSHGFPWGWVNQEVIRPFDLATGPLLRVGYAPIGKGEYIFLIILHHIIVDLWTKNQLAQELEYFYNNQSISNESPQIGFGASYADCIAQDIKFQSSPSHELMLSFWRRQLGQAKKTIDLPTDNPRTPTLNLVGGSKDLTIDRSLTRELVKFSRTNGTKVFLTLLAAYSVLLHHYSGKSQLTIGVPFSNRRSEDRKDTMGCLMNILPIVIDFSDSPSFQELLGQIKKLMLLAHRNQEVWYKTIVDHSGIIKDHGQNPLFQAGFTFHPPMKLQLDGLKIQPIKVHNNGSQLDVFGVFWEEGEQIEGYFEYNSTLFLEETIDRYAANFMRILQAVVSCPDCPISSFPVLANLEKHRLLVEWNQTSVPTKQYDGVCGRFEDQVMQRPNVIATKFRDRSYTYQGLNIQANKLAHYLRRQGLEKGTLIGLHMESSNELLIALLAVLKIGGVYVPLDPKFPVKRLMRIIELTEIPVILTSDTTKDLLPLSEALNICFEGIGSLLESEKATNLNVPISSDDLAYVTFTSGSTGEPKGVMVHHGALVNFLSSMAKKPGLTPEDTLLAVTSLSFDISVLELFLPLICGASIVIASREDVVDGAKLLEKIQDNNISIMQATPTTWRMLMAAGWETPSEMKVLCGGEPMSAELGKELIRRSDNVWNMYGPTETTVWSTCHRISSSDRTIFVGRPIDNTQVFILNKKLNPVPIGVSGDLYISGAGVSKGYWSRADLSSVAFVKSPFSTEGDSIIYRTGDLARYHSDGNIEILGRVDHQVKIRGYRIELGEIEKALDEEQSILQAVVIAVDRELDQKSLVAYLVRKTGAKSSHAEIRESLITELPDYMVPSAFVDIEEFPLTLNGKIDRSGLPSPSFSRTMARNDFLPPRSEVEARIAAVWQDVLKVDRVGLRDRFFEIGGNSLLAVQVASRLKDLFGAKMSVVSLFQYPTVESLANFLSMDVAEDGVKEQSLDRAMKREKRRAQIRKRPASK